jgi:hypothetical protein
MGQSYRIRTELGISKSINVQLDQEFEFLEILSLKLQQEDVYAKSCANYGVVVGRVTANNGFGVPNARVSVFIPIESVDESNPIISSIYPYKSPNDKNEDGYRYNLLPYEKSYSTHAATGTLPTRLDSLTGSTAVEIYDKYYKFTSKTNESGDYMIMGVPQGQQSIVMDVDLSDIGEFSLTPQDLIRMGLATDAQVAGNRFRTSADLNSLPQIINVVKFIEVSPLWGDPELCTIAINRLDFDLRDDANVDIQPTSTFMGSIYSTPDKMRIRPNSRPKDNFGNMCGLVAGPGQILAIRQTIDQDEDGNPVLEQYQLEQAGNIIDGSGVWLTELPMNLDYFITNEFGEKVISYDPTVGIPTKAKYRFKIKWQQPPTLSDQTRRPYFLVPNIKEYGWSNPDTDPLTLTGNPNKKLASSYYFGLAWSGYTNGFSKTSGNEYYDRLNEVIDCEDTFYEFNFNKVYTVSQLIDEFKKGGRSRFVGIKEIDSDDCESTINKFPVNEGFRNFDLLYFIFSFLFQIIQLIGIPLIIAIRIALFIIFIVRSALCGICGFYLGWPFKTYPFGFICRGLGIDCSKDPNTQMKLTMLTYPDCDACECDVDVSETKAPPPLNQPTKLVQPTGSLTYFSYPLNYNTEFQYFYENALFASNEIDIYVQISSEALSGLNNYALINDPTKYKLPISNLLNLPGGGDVAASSKDLPLGERVNLFNQRSSYFSGLNRIKVTFASSSNTGKFHYDNTITVLASSGGNQTYNPGDLLTFVNPSTSDDKNFLFSASTSDGEIFGISGTSYHSGPATISVNYCDPSSPTTIAPSVSYSLPSGSTTTNYIYPSDVEYYQVVTAITVSQAISLWNTGLTQTFPNILNSPTKFNTWRQSGLFSATLTRQLSGTTVNPLQFYDNYTDEIILILQRGVDPYSPKYTNKYGIGKILGLPSEDDLTIEVETRMNIPIQPLPISSSISVQSFANQNEIYYPSYFFKPGIVGSTTPGLEYSSYTTNNLGYYGSLDASNYSSTYMNTVSKRVVTKTSNGFYSASIGSSTYDLSEDVSGMGMMSITNYTSNPCSLWDYNNWGTGANTISYRDCTDTLINLNVNGGETGSICVLNGTSPSASAPTTIFLTNTPTPCSIPAFFVGSWPTSVMPSRYYISNAYGTAFTMSITDSVKNVMRTDRLPTSDGLDGGSWSVNPCILQQNLQFQIYPISEAGPTLTQGFGSGASQVRPDIDDLPYAGEVLTSFSCPGMVPLDCYGGFGSTFQVISPCNDPNGTGYNYVKNGCYILLDKPRQLFSGIRNDVGVIWPEWGYRFRFMYGLCRGVLSQTFTNNWINGSLFMFPIQTDVFYDRQNQPIDPKIPQEIVYFDKPTTNFYFRSSPYSDNQNKFVGRRAGDTAVNELNLMFPTTIINLGYKDSFYSEITFDPSTKAYIIPSLNPTSYGDTSDLVNLFVVSRMVDSGFLEQITSFANDAIGVLFSRPDGGTGILGFFTPKARVDGDFVQLCSINSEIGNINFSPEYYATTPTNSPTNVLGTPNNPVMAVWFSSTTEDLQTKDYLTPGRINFRTPNNSANYPYPYGIKSQVAPHYQWELRNNTNNLIFGSQLNNWATGPNDIVQNRRYQSLDRISLITPNYFIPPTVTANDLNARGYIFSNDISGNYVSTITTSPNKFIVGAPFHFYFGIIKGETALDLFKTKYSVIE